MFAALEDEEAIENDPVEGPPSHELYERRLAAVREGQRIVVALALDSNDRLSDDLQSAIDLDVIVSLIPRSATCPSLLCESRKRDGIPTLLFSYRVGEAY